MTHRVSKGIQQLLLEQFNHDKKGESIKISVDPAKLLPDF